jgi:hypothetical protein
MTQFIAVDKTTNQVLFGVGRPDAPDLEGPMNAPPLNEDNIVYYSWQGDLRLSDGPTPNAVLEWHDAPVWVVSIEDIIAHAISQIDDAADNVRMLVLSKQTNTAEYLRAEQQAREFKTAGYPADNVPSCVQSWVDAKWRDNWTAQQAADNIISTADNWYGLLESIRKIRLIAKEDVRHAATEQAVADRVNTAKSDLFAVLSQAV